MNKFYINKHLFFLIEDGQVLIWNYKDHEQFLVETKYFYELLNVSGNGYCENKKIQEELVATNIITNNKPELDNWGWDCLSKIFHIGTKNQILKDFPVGGSSNESFAQSYLKECENLDTMPDIFYEKEGEKIILPKPDISQLRHVSFYDAILNRKTSRKYYSKSISLNTLSTILHTSFGLIHGEEWKDFTDNSLKQTAIRKASPASGGVHLEEAYIVIYRVDEIKPGLYHYDVKNHALTLLKLGDFEKKVIDMNFQQFFSQGLAFGVYLTARFEKSWWKYKHSSAYRAALMDIGHASQTFQLSSAAFGLNTWLTGAFFDDQVDDFLDIDGVNESAILFVGAGIGANQTFPDELC